MSGKEAVPAVPSLGAAQFGSLAALILMVGRAVLRTRRR